MIAYVVAGVVALVLLVAAYRMLGGSASRPVDPHVLLRAARDGAASALSELTETADRGLPQEPGRAADVLKPVRRRLDAASQQLQQVDVIRLGDDAAAAHALLAVAVDELSWAVRMLQSSAYAGSAGMQQACDALTEHAAQCLREASAVDLGSVVAEEVRSAP